MTKLKHFEKMEKRVDKEKLEAILEIQTDESEVMVL